MRWGDGVPGRVRLLPELVPLAGVGGEVVGLERLFETVVVGVWVGGVGGVGHFGG